MTGVIIQTRLGSTRLPNKAVADIEGMPMLRRVIQRVRRATWIDQVCVDFPKKDQSLLAVVAGTGCGWWFGSDDRDVLGDYEAIARTCRYDTIVRITGDCPCIMPSVIDQVLQGHEAHCCMPSFMGHYTAFLDVDGWDTEVFDWPALKWAHQYCELLAWREHVTQGMRNHEGISVMQLGMPDYPKVKLSVDTQDDLDRVREYYRALGDDFGVEDVIRKAGSDNRGNGHAGQGPGGCPSPIIAL